MPKRLAPIETKRLYQKIAGVLRASIADGTFPVGSFLPPERDLAKQLGVSRASVREALIALEVQGSVSVRVGAGVQVIGKRKNGPMAVRTDAEPLIGPLDLLDARLVVETEAAGLAASNATPDDVAQLKRTLQQMIEDCEKGSTKHHGDRQFHLVIARASGNAAMAYLVTKLWDQRPTTLQERLETLFSTPERFTAAIRDHRAILKAIRERRPEAAREAMRKHLERVRDSYSRAIEAIV